MRPHGDDQIGQCHPLLAKTGQTVVDNTADQPLPAGMHAADVATVARGDQQRQTVGGHHPHLLPGYRGKHRVGVRARRQRLLIMMNLITMHQLHRSQLGIGKGGGFMDIKKSVADARDRIEQTGGVSHRDDKRQGMMSYLRPGDADRQGGGPAFFTRPPDAYQTMAARCWRCISQNTATPASTMPGAEAAITPTVPVPRASILPASSGPLIAPRRPTATAVPTPVARMAAG